MSMGNNSRSMGAGGSGGGYPPNESYNFTMGQETNRQILSILIRIQQDTNNVITRLSYLEATVLSLQVRIILQFYKEFFLVIRKIQNYFRTICK